MPKPLGGWGSVIGNPVLVPCAGFGWGGPWCPARRAGARCAGVVRARVVRMARRATRDYVRGVIPSNARYAGVIPCRGGAVMPLRHAKRGGQRAQPAVPADRFARTIVRILTGGVVRLRRLNGNPFGVRGVWSAFLFWFDAAYCPS